MARTKVNKSAIIKSLLTKHPDKGPTEIAELATKEAGSKVTAQYVSMTKSTGKKKKKGKKKHTAIGNGKQADGWFGDGMKAAGLAAELVREVGKDRAVVFIQVAATFVGNG